MPLARRWNRFVGGFDEYNLLFVTVERFDPVHIQEVELGNLVTSISLGVLQEEDGLQGFLWVSIWGPLCFFCVPDGTS